MLGSTLDGIVVSVNIDWLVLRRALAECFVSVVAQTQTTLMPLSVGVHYLSMLSTLTLQSLINTYSFLEFFCIFWYLFSHNKLTKLLSIIIYFSFFQLTEGSQLLLSACLSCDGCLSEDENIKISQQSLEEVKRVLALNKVHTALCI